MATSLVSTTTNKLINIDETLHSCCTQPADVHEGGYFWSDFVQGR